MATFRVRTASELQSALEEASNNSARVNRILIRDDIELTNGLIYSGSGRLKIDGDHSSLTAANGFESYSDDSDSSVAGKGVALITSQSSAKVEIKDLVLDGNNGSSQHGFELDVPDGATGTVEVTFKGVEVSGFWDHGIHIDDQSGAPGAGGDSGGGKDDSTGANSDASLLVKVIDSQIIDNGGFEDISVSDSDGLRIDEGGEGSAKVIIRRSEFLRNGADGFELDETGTGDAEVIVRDSSFNENGPFDLNDTDDGLDVDEAGDGSLIVDIRNSKINNNKDEGLDLDEAGEGDIRLTMRNSEANFNGNSTVVGATDLGGTGVKLSEEDGGDIITNFRRVEANGNDDYGFRLEQFGGGEIDATFRQSSAVNNVNDDGIRLESYQTADGAEEEIYDPINALFINVVATDNGESALRADGSTGTLSFRGGEYSAPIGENLFDFQDFGGTVMF